MLGSIHEAEDAAQDTFLRAWRARNSYEGRASFRTWLYRIATNVCLRALDRRARRGLPEARGPHAAFAPLGPPDAETNWLEPYPIAAVDLIDHEGEEPEARYEAREAVQLAFVAAIQSLPPRQRAVLLLRDVLGFSTSETGKALSSSTASVTSALQRARSTVRNR